MGAGKIGVAREGGRVSRRGVRAYDREIRPVLCVFKREMQGEVRFGQPDYSTDGHSAPEESCDAARLMSPE